MKIVFIDSDILIDVILVRTPHFTFSSQVLNLTNITFITTVHSLLNVHYVIKKHIGIENAQIAIKRLTEKLLVITEDGEIVNRAINSSFTDFEDAVQFFAALNANADIIITRNIKDYKNATIPVLTAEQFLKTIL